MRTKSENILRSQKPGYWAVQIRLNAASGPDARYLCHAVDDRGASTMAGDLMGGVRNGRGFDCFWIDPTRLEQSRAMFPALGASQKIDDPKGWADLMLAHEASEVAYQRAQVAVSRTISSANNPDPCPSKRPAAPDDRPTDRWEGEGGAIVRSRIRVNFRPQPKLREGQGAQYETPAPEDRARRNMSGDQPLYGKRWGRGAGPPTDVSYAGGAKGSGGTR